MEQFPAIDEEQWEFIKKVIDDCDYYLLIIGGRYGSTTSDGMSYTEKEYEYAIGKGIKVIALLHKDPESIAVSKTDKNPELAERLGNFRKKVEANRLVQYWTSAADLPGIVALNLMATIKRYPAVGWVRASSVASTELLEEINALRKQNDELRALVDTQKVQMSTTFEDIADMTEKIEIHGAWRQSIDQKARPWKHTLSWTELFALIAPHVLQHPDDEKMKNFLRIAVLKCAGIVTQYSSMEDQDYQTVKIQFKIYGLIELTYLERADGFKTLVWSLTDKGESTMLQLRAVRKST